MDSVMIIMAFLSAIAVGCIATHFLIPVLRRLKFGQTILEEYGPTWHKSKQGTPTMGGLVFIIATTVGYLLFAFPYYTAELGGIGLLSQPMVTLLFGLLFALIGFADDFIKIAKKRNLGLTASQKMILQLVLSCGYLVYLAVCNGGATTVEIPFFGVVWELSYAYYFLALILMVGFVNAVNLTDGVDGLCTSVTLPVSVFFCLAAAIVYGATELAVLAAALAGSCIAFLIFNWNPAKIFMGDVGSLFLGAMVVGFSFALKQPLLLPVVGIIYLIETLSVMIQVTYFKLTHGKRIFKMTPIHHHFELSGYSEKKICFLFSGVTVVACIAAFVWLYLVK